MSIPTQPKPKPEHDSNTHTCRQCDKCGGTGFYCMGVENGRAYSRTGFNCYKCRGKGWIVAWKRGMKKAFWANVKPVQVIRDEAGKVIQVIQ